MAYECEHCKQTDDACAESGCGQRRAVQVNATEHGFEIEVRLAVRIPRKWSALLKLASSSHYDRKCRESGNHGTINGLHNVAGPMFPSTIAVSWRDLDLMAKVMEQAYYHTNDYTLLSAISLWLAESKKRIEARRTLLESVPDCLAKGVHFGEPDANGICSACGFGLDDDGMIATTLTTSTVTE